jgi:hypothetical protein
MKMLAHQTIKNRVLINNIFPELFLKLNVPIINIPISAMLVIGQNTVNIIGTRQVIPQSYKGN